MKRLLLLVFLLSVIALYGYSQSLKITNVQGTDISNSSITQAGSTDSSTLITYLYVKNISTQALSVYCKKVMVTALDSCEVTMCWAGGCYPAFVNVSPNGAPMAAGETITDFSGHYTWAGTSQPNFKPGESIVRWVFFSETNPNDSVSLTVKYTSYPLGVDTRNIRQGVLSAAYPNPADASASFNYSVPAGSQGTIVIRNLVGAAVQTEQVTPGTGNLTISTSGLSNGIYFYSLMLDGKLNQTRKLVVKH